MDEDNKWLRVNNCLERLKVDGGHIYRWSTFNGGSMVFVPEIDLKRYESHLRDAYNKGFQDGRNSILEEKQY